MERQQAVPAPNTVLSGQCTASRRGRDEAVTVLRLR
jgi:hypothetical protein